MIITCDIFMAFFINIARETISRSVVQGVL